MESNPPIPMVIRNTSDAPDALSTTIRDPNAPSPDDFICNGKQIPTGGDQSPSDSESDTQSTCSHQQIAAVSNKLRCVDQDIGAVCIASLEELSFLTIRAVSATDDKKSDDFDVGLRSRRALEKFSLTPIWSDQRAGRDASILVKVSDRLQAAEALAKEFQGDRLLELSATEPVTLLSLVPKQHASRVGAASRFFTSLAQANVKIHRVVCGASTSSISCVIDGRETRLAVSAAHNAFNFPERVVSLLLLGNNRTSRGLLEELHRQRHHLRTSLNLVIRVCAVITEYGPMKLANSTEADKGSDACQTQAEGVPLLEALNYLKNEEDGRAAESKERLKWRQQYDMTKDTISSQLRRLPTPVLVDCNEFPRTKVAEEEAQEDLAALADCYLHCLQLGVRLVITESVSLNAFAGVVRATEQDQACGPLALGLKRIHSMPESMPVMEESKPQKKMSLPGIMSMRPERGLEILKERERLLRYDSCIAADIPLLPAIRSRLQSGSRLRVVQGLLSSSIGLILDMITRQGKTLREAVEFADNEKITETILKNDLGGYDVLEKLQVIAFALGWELPASKVRRVPLIPEAEIPDEAKDGVGRQQVFEALDKFDQRTGFSKNAAKVHKSGRRLRYIATIELRSSKFARADISLEEVDEDHFTFPINAQEISFALFDEPPLEWTEKERARKRANSDEAINNASEEEVQLQVEERDRDQAPGPFVLCGFDGDDSPKEAWPESTRSSDSKTLENSGLEKMTSHLSPLVLRGPGTGYAHGVGALSDVVRLVKNTTPSV